MTFWVWLTLSAIFLMGVVVASQAGSPLGMIVFAGAAWLFGTLAKRERR